MDISEILYTGITLIMIIIVMAGLVVGLFMDPKAEKEMDDLLDEPVHHSLWMVCPSCPDSNFNLKPGDDQCIVECATCYKSYTVDMANGQLIERK